MFADLCARSLVVLENLGQNRDDGAVRGDGQGRQHRRSSERLFRVLRQQDTKDDQKQGPGLLEELLPLLRDTGQSIC